MLVPAKARNTVIFIGSLIFYGLGEPVYVFLMLLAIAVNYLAALRMDKCREEEKDSGKGRLHGEKRIAEKSRMTKTLILVLCIVFNLGLLLYFKYGAFFVSCFSALSGRAIIYENPALPLGISFYTFQILSYVVDVYRGDIEAEKNFVDLGAYISMFPQLIAGPIVIYRDIRTSLKDPAGRISLDGIARGAEIFTIGLGSKVLLANRFGQIWNTMSEMGYANISTPAAWIGAIAYTLQIYFDFNGYSLMAIGLGRMLGFELPENFNLPYTAGSVTSFWKRWHMTLTSFFRTYIYIPLGGNRKGKKRTYLNMLIVWAITGFWHGADFSFIVWGLYYFVFLSAERLLFGEKDSSLNLRIKKVKEKLIGGPKYRALRLLKRIASHSYTMVVVITGWVIFASENLADAGTYIGRMFPLLTFRFGGLQIASFSAVMYVWLLLGALFSTQIPGRLYSKIKEKPIFAFILLAVFWACVVQLSDGAYNPFLYFRF